MGKFNSYVSNDKFRIVPVCSETWLALSLLSGAILGPCCLAWLLSSDGLSRSQVPKAENQLLLFTDVSPFCPFKEHPLLCLSAPFSQLSLWCRVSRGRQSGRFSAAFLPHHPLPWQQELFLPPGLERIH